MSSVAIGKYNYLEAVFGKELIDSIPEVESPPRKELESYYANFFDNSPYDVVKMVIPPGRPSLVFRYISTEPTLELNVEVWKQRPRGYEWWSNRTYTHAPLWETNLNGEIREKTADIFESMMEGAFLEKTGHRFFPNKFGTKFEVKV